MKIKSCQECTVNTSNGLAKFTYFENDFRLFFPGEVANDEAIKYLVLYDKISNSVTVDGRAPHDYKVLATLHEYICQGRQFEELANVQGDVSEFRCSLVESFILNDPLITQHFDVVTYAKSRLLMFNFLIKENLNPELNDMFKESDSFEIAETLLQNMGDFFQQEQSKSHIKELDD